MTASEIRARADWFRWLAEQIPARRVLTQEECHVLAREMDRFAALYDYASYVPEKDGVEVSDDGR